MSSPVGRDTARQPAGSPRTRGPSPKVYAANLVGPISFPEELPVSARREEITRALAEHQVIIVCGETGSGKTTQLPKICLAAGRGLGAGGKGLIGHTQPRRLAATSVAKRIAQELGTPLGEHVGYKIRFADQTSRGASVKLMTDGILLAETQTDPLLRAYDTIIIDEAHERSLNIDFLLGYLREVLPRRPDLKVIVTSATIDAERFAQHFASASGPAPVIEVSGRMYPVEVRYRPLAQGVDIEEAIVDAVDELSSAGPGDVLVFLPGEREIRDTAEALRKHHFARSPSSLAPQILPLFARLSAEEQERIFRTSQQRRIVLATNVAETSLTVPGIRYVVDTGVARVKRYSYRQKVEQLQVEPISQASANQRAGRCGRVAAGICVRLYADDEFSLRPKFSDPEILRSSLAAVILRMKALRFDDIERFAFVEAPQGRAIADGYALLQELGALDDSNQLTDLGKQLAKLPLDPRIGRMLIAARETGCLSEMTVIASALSVQDARERPFGQEEAADQAHRKFADDRSEFLGILKRWRYFEDLIAHKKSNRKLADELKSNFLHTLRMREWRDVHGQLHSTMSELGWHFNELPMHEQTPYEQLHLALLAGLLGNIACKDAEEAHYEGARGIKVLVWPGSSLAKKAGRWIVAAELVETSRLFARTVAKIEPEWIERVAGHLLRKSHGDPHWEKRSGRVVALERATLYGLTVYHGRRVDYGALNAEQARKLFIRGALVGGDYEPRVPSGSGQGGGNFLVHNLKLVSEIEKLEHKSRRLDVLVDEELIAAFYDAKLPADMFDANRFEHWYRRELKLQSRLLYLDREGVMRHEAAGITTDQFPKRIVFGGVEMALDYHFEPGIARDGVTLTVPLYALNLVDDARCDWLVPGMRRDKVQALLKSLPQKLRRHCVPLPDYAAGFIDRLPEPRGSLVQALIRDLHEECSLQVVMTDFKIETLAPHLFMNYRVVDEHGRQLGMDRSLPSLRATLGRSAREQFQQLAQLAGPGKIAEAPKSASAAIRVESAVQRNFVGNPAIATSTFDVTVPITDWSFGELPEIMEIRRKQGRMEQVLIGYPALVDDGTACRLEVYDDPAAAQIAHRRGLRRLFALQLKEPLKLLDRNIPQLTQLAVHFMPLGTQEQLKAQIVELALERACMSAPLPVNAERFRQRCNEGRARLGLLTGEIGRLAGAVLADYAAVVKKLSQAKPQAQAHADMQQQLAALMSSDFLVKQPYSQLAHFSRYLKGLALRIEKLRIDPLRDAARLAELQPLLAQWQRKNAMLKGQHDERMIEVRWLLEELRISLFAQELRTPVPVSAKRLQKVLDALR